MPDWYSTRPGYYTTRYRGKTLEVVRNSNPTDPRRYVAYVDGKPWPHACHTIPQCKTKAMKWADNPGLHDPADQAEDGEDTAGDGPGGCAVIPYVEPPVPVLKGGDVMIAFAIIGKLPADKFSTAVSNLQAAVDMLREEGGHVECDIEPPPKVKL
jgi:hypothetical protein